MGHGQISNLDVGGRAPGFSSGSSPSHPGLAITFMTRKKTSVPKTVSCGWHHSSHRFWGSGSAGQDGDEFLVIKAHELLSNSVSKCCSMDSWGRDSGRSACPHPFCHPSEPQLPYPFPVRDSEDGSAIAELQPCHLKNDLQTFSLGGFRGLGEKVYMEGPQRRVFYCHRQTWCALPGKP